MHVKGKSVQFPFHRGFGKFSNDMCVHNISALRSNTHHLSASMTAQLQDAKVRQDSYTSLFGKHCI